MKTTISIFIAVLMAMTIVFADNAPVQSSAYVNNQQTVWVQKEGFYTLPDVTNILGRCSQARKLKAGLEMKDRTGQYMVNFVSTPALKTCSVLKQELVNVPFQDCSKTASVKVDHPDMGQHGHGKDTEVCTPTTRSMKQWVAITN